MQIFKQKQPDKTARLFLFKHTRLFGLSLALNPIRDSNI